ncbi:MAG: hypothetical protein RIT45_3730 [Pseudomonadota bacterium]
MTPGPLPRILVAMSEAPAARASAANATWITGAFRCVVLGDGNVELQGGGRLHDVTLQDARAEAVQRVDAPGEPPTDALWLGHVEPLWICLRDDPRWMRVAVQDAFLRAPRMRLGRDDGDRSLTLLQGELVARLAQAERPFAGVSASAGRVSAAPATIAARSLPVSAGGIAWADAQVGGAAPPGCAPVATGCAVAPIGCLAFPLALAGLLAALAGGAALSVGLGALGLLALLLAFRWLFGGRSWRWGGLRGWGMAGLGWLLGALAVLPPLWAFLAGDCPGHHAAGVVLLVLAAAAAAASEIRFARGGVFGLGLLMLALLAFGERDCQGGGLEAAQQWTQAALTRDADAERAERLQTGGGGRLSIDTALEQSWPPNAICGRTIHFSGDLLFGYDEAKLTRRADPQLRKLATLLARHPEVRLEIHGHADQRGDPRHNLRLSQKRAAAVRQWLVRHRALAGTRVWIVGHGAADPLVLARDDDDDERLRLNRRVEVVLRCAEAAAGPELPAAPTSTDVAPTDAAPTDAEAP